MRKKRCPVCGREAPCFYVYLKKCDWLPVGVPSQRQLDSSREDTYYCSWCVVEYQELNRKFHDK